MCVHCLAFVVIVPSPIAHPLPRTCHLMFEDSQCGEHRSKATWSISPPQLREAEGSVPPAWKGTIPFQRTFPQCIPFLPSLEQLQGLGVMLDRSCWEDVGVNVKNSCACRRLAQPLPCTYCMTLVRVYLSRCTSRRLGHDPWTKAARD